MGFLAKCSENKSWEWDFSPETQKRRVRIYFFSQRRPPTSLEMGFLIGNVAVESWERWFRKDFPLPALGNEKSRDFQFLRSPATRFWRDGRFPGVIFPGSDRKPTFPEHFYRPLGKKLFSKS